MFRSFQNVFLANLNSKKDECVNRELSIVVLEIQMQVADSIILIDRPCRFWCLTVLFQCNVSKELVTVSTGSFQITCCEVIAKFGIKSDVDSSLACFHVTFTILISIIDLLSNVKINNKWQLT